jgi:hypothetical protein
MDKSMKTRKGESMQTKCVCFTISVIDKSKFIEIVRYTVSLRDRRNEAWITWEMPIARRKQRRTCILIELWKAINITSKWVRPNGSLPWHEH